MPGAGTGNLDANPDLADGSDNPLKDWNGKV